MMAVRWIVPVLALCLSGFSGAIATPIHYITDLGAVGAGTATGIGNSGHVVGWHSDPHGNLGSFLLGEGGVQTLSGSIASGVNSNGHAAGTSYGPSGAQAVIWSGETAQPLGSLGGESYGMAISDQGYVTGSSANAAGQGRAFLHDGGTMRDLGTLAGGNWSAGYGVNAAEHVVGTSENAAGNFEAFLWTPDGGMRGLGALGGTSSYATGINGAGLIIGHSATVDGWLQAFLYSGGAMQGLGTLGGSQSYAYGINSGGLVVGYSWITGNERTSAFLYRDGILWDLNVLLPAGSGWVLLEAYGINDAGQIAGAGLLGGERRAFLLDLSQLPMVDNPEPSTLFLLGGGLGLLAAGRYGKRRLKTPAVR